LNLAKAEMVAKLELLLQQLSTFEAIDQTLEDLSHLAQADFIGLTFVNYSVVIQKEGETERL
jgi:hypothetical protein